MGLKPEAASPSSIYRCTQRYGRMAALVGLLSPTSWGALVLMHSHFRGSCPFLWSFQPKEGS